VAKSYAKVVIIVRRSASVQYSVGDRGYANFAEFPFRDCMKSGLGVVIHYCSRYEKTLPNGPF
jgi:hypothetical protein